MIELLQTNAYFLIGATTILGLLIGSFLNVVIHRLPIMMESTWTIQCRELLELEDTQGTAKENEPFNLIKPGSRCPHCGHKIGALENIPVLSYVVQKGKCRGCSAAISPRYPIIELVTAILSAIVVWQLSFSWAALCGLLFTWAMIALTMIDFDHQLLPDDIILPLVWLGLLLSLAPIFASTSDAIIGACAGYLSLWLIFHLFKLITGKEGMGYGDFKLFALFGAWFGWQCLPVVLLLSSVVGAVVGITLIVIKGRDRNIPIPFGPYLAGAGWIYLLWGEAIVDAYLG